VVLALVVIGAMLLSAETRIRPPRDCLSQHQSSMSLSDTPDLDSQASSSDAEDDERTISTVATDMDASSTFNVLHDDLEFNSLERHQLCIDDALAVKIV